MHQEDPRAGVAADGRLQQVQEHDAQAALQAAGEGSVRAQEVQPRQQESSRSGWDELESFFSLFFFHEQN